MRKLLTCLVLFISLISISNIEVSAANLSKSDISGIVFDKEVKVKFNTELNGKTVNSKNVIVTDGKGKGVKGVTVKLLDNKKEISIGSSKIFVAGSTYYLTLTKNIESTKGVKLKSNLKLKFTVDKTTLEVSKITPALNSYLSNLENQLQQRNTTITSLNEKIKALEAKVIELEKPKVTVTPTPTSSDTELSKTINDITIQIDKVVQDSDSLKIYVTYINNTTDEIIVGDSLSKVVADGKQFEYDTLFNFERYYNKNVPKADSSIEPGVTEQSVIFFKPVTADKINIVLNADWEDYRYNNITIQK